MIKKIFLVVLCLCFNQITNAAPPLDAYGHLPGVELKASVEFIKKYNPPD